MLSNAIKEECMYDEGSQEDLSWIIKDLWYFNRKNGDIEGLFSIVVGEIPEAQSLTYTSLNNGVVGLVKVMVLRAHETIRMLGEGEYERRLRWSRRLTIVVKKTREK